MVLAFDAFAKSIRKANHVRRYTIQSTDWGWEVRTDHNSESVRRVYYRDWHRVERAQRTFTLELEALEDDGWQEVPLADPKSELHG